MPSMVWTLTPVVLVLWLVSLLVGAYPFSFSQLWLALWHQGDATAIWVLWELRLPRSVAAVLVGAALGFSGAMMQGLFRNPLADASLLGVSSAAALGAVTALYLALPSGFLPLLAMAFALFLLLFILRFSQRQGEIHLSLLLLLGIALNAVMVSFLGLLTYVAQDNTLRQLTFWTLGSLSRVSWWSVGQLLLALILALWLLHPWRRALNAFQWGADVCLHLGYSAQGLSWRLVIFSAVLVGVSVAWVGPLGFVGLVAPHMVRLIWGEDYRFLLWGSALTGGVLVLFADLLARSLLMPSELPLGLVLSFMGGPVFLLLIFKYAGRGF